MGPFIAFTWVNTVVFWVSEGNGLALSIGVGSMGAPGAGAPL